MGIFSKFERKVEDGVEGAASAFEKSALTPVQITKKAEKQMRREKVVGAGRQIAPTLYTCLVSPQDDARLFGYYPTLAGEVETYLQAKANDYGFSLDCKPLVRFVADPDLHKGKFDIIAELVAAPTIAELRAQENERYGVAAPQKPIDKRSVQAPVRVTPQQVPQNVPRAIQNAASQVQPVQSVQQVQQQQIQQQQMQPVKPVRQQQESPNDQFAGLDVFADEVPYAASASVPTTVPPVIAPVIPQIGESEEVENVFFYDEENDIAYSLTGAPEKIGRESTNEIVVSDINASRTHAEIHMEPNGSWIISDLGSTNGLYVNGRRVNAAQLRDADVVLIGTTRLEFQDLRH